VDFAKIIYKRLKDYHDIFIDIDNIKVGDIWSNTIENNISTCNIFIIIVTHGALESQEVEKEVLQAKRENKIIIPCIYKDVNYDEIKWDLSRYQGIDFNNGYDLVRSLYSKIERRKIKDNNLTSTKNEEAIYSETSINNIFTEEQYHGNENHEVLNTKKDFEVKDNDIGFLASLQGINYPKRLGSTDHKIIKLRDSFKIFISYSRRDAHSLYEKLFDALTHGGYDVFKTINNIVADDIWSDTVEENISKCNVFIRISPLSVKSTRCEKEYLSAKKGNKKIIPCIKYDVNVLSLERDYDMKPIFPIFFIYHDDLIKEVSKILYEM
jgi:hypothetical protein